MCVVACSCVCVCCGVQLCVCMCVLWRTLVCVISLKDQHTSEWSTSWLTQSMVSLCLITDTHLNGLQVGSHTAWLVCV